MKTKQRNLVLGLALSMTVASTAVPREVLPRPEEPFKGRIECKAKDSTPDFPKEVAAPKGAPNVLPVLTDDVGFGASSTFGGPVPTPAFDRLLQPGGKTRRIGQARPLLDGR